MSSSVRSITVNNAAIDTSIANIDTYAVSFTTNYTLDTANIVGIQSFVFNRKADPKFQQSVVKVGTNGSCKLLQTHADLESAEPINIPDISVHTYLVTLINNGTTSENALNHTMKTVTKLS